MRMLKRLLYRLFPHYVRIEVRCVSWSEGDRLIRESDGKPDDERWVIAKEEDTNVLIDAVWLERRRRVTA